MAKRFLTLALLALLAAMLPDLPGRAEAPGKALTLMVYMTGSDLESSQGAATADIQEMMASGFDDGLVNLVLMVGGSKSWELGYDPATTYVLQAGRRGLRAVESRDAVNMGEADNLAWFLNLAAERFPAENYALILWDHGGGPMEGVCFDSLNGNDSLSLTELEAALAASPFAGDGKLAWIGFDACLMNAVETASVCAPYAKYMIASQETEPATGWNYAFLNGIEGDADGAATGRRAVDSYFDVPGAGDLSLTLACVDLSRIEAVERRMDALFAGIGGMVDAKSFSGFSNHRRDAKAFGRETTGWEYDLVDLQDLAEQYSGADTAGVDTLAAAIRDAVVYQRSNQARANGLSVYSPYHNKGYYESSWSEQYDGLGFSKGYRDYLERYAALWLGGALADFSGLEARGEYDDARHTQELSLTLTPEQAENFASAEVLVLAEYPGNADVYSQVYTVDGVALGEDGALRAEYDFTGLYAVDEYGQPITGQLNYTVVGDSYFVIVVLQTSTFAQHAAYTITDDARAEDYENEAAILRCAMGEDGELEIEGVISLDEGELNLGKSARKLDTEKWRSIMFMNSRRSIARDEDGNTLPFSRWPYFIGGVSGGVGIFGNNTNEYVEIDSESPWRLQMRTTHSDGMNLYAQFVVNDTRDEPFASDLIPLANPTLTASAEVDAVAGDDDVATLRLTRVDAVEADTAGGVHLRLEVENHTDGLLRLQPAGVMLNDVLLENDMFDKAMGYCQPGQTLRCYYRVEPERLPPMSDTLVRSVALNVEVRRVDADAEGRTVMTTLGTYTLAAETELEVGNLITRHRDDYIHSASAEQDGVDYELLDLARRDGDVLTALLHIHNHSGEAIPVTLRRFSSKINGFYFRDNCFCPRGDYDYDAVLPNDTEVFLELTIEPTSGPRGSSAGLEAVNGLEYWQIGEIETISLVWEHVGVADRCVDLPLEHPLVTGVEPGDPSAYTPMYDFGQLAMRFHAMGVEDGRLSFDMDSWNDIEEGELIYLFLDNAYVNGKCVDLTCAYEHSFEALQLEIGEEKRLLTTLMMLQPSTRERCRFELDLAGVGLMDEPLERVALALGFCDGEGMAYLSPFTLEFTDPVLPDAMDDQPTFGVRLALPDWLDEPMDPWELIDREVDLPDAPERYAVTLTHRVTDAQVAGMRSCEACLVRVDGDVIENIAGVFTGSLHGDELRAPFSGLLCAVRGDPLAAIQYIVRSDGAWRYDVQCVGTLTNSYWWMHSYDPLIVELDADGARVTEFGVKTMDVETDVFTPISMGRVKSFLNRERFELLEDGCIESDFDWEYVDSEDYFLDRDAEGRTGFELKPAADIEDLMVVFMIYREDGTRFGLPPIPYAEACAAAE